MNKITPLIIVAAMIVTWTSSVQASTITEILSGTDNGFGFSGIHNAERNHSMSGPNFSKVALDPNQTSFFHIHDHSGNDNFVLHMILTDKGNSLLTLSGVLDFRVGPGELIGTLDADFSDENVHTDTFFKFVQGTTNIAGNGVPSPNGYSNDLLSLWGANSTDDPIPGSIGFDSNTATLGIDLVLKWDEAPTISEPGSLALLALGLLGFGFTHPKRSVLAA